MTRCIAILTLALTAALSADQAFAGADNDCDGPTFDANIRQDDYEILNNSQPERDLDALIAIIAFEYGPEAAYLTLRDMGFSAYDANDRLLNSLAVTSPSQYWDWSSEPTPHDILRDMGFSPYEADAVLNFVNVKDAYSTIFSFSD